MTEHISSPDSERSVQSERGISKRNPWFAFLLSLLLPGLGQLYNDGVARGLRFFALGLGLSFLEIVVGGTLMISFGVAGFVAMMLLGWSFSLAIAAEAAYRAKRVQSVEKRAYDRWWVYLLILIVYTASVRAIPSGFLTEHLSPRMSFRVFHLPSGSMSPTLEPGDLVIADPAVRNDWQREDLVVFRSPDGEQIITKRIVGLPGETLEFRDGVCYIDGKEFRPGYWTERIQGEWGPIDVPPGKYFMMGDNVNNSRDSRFIGSIPQEDFVALILFRVYGKEIGTDLTER